MHELGCAPLHAEGAVSREVAEVESVAYIVCDAVGLDSGDYSFNYAARWSDGSSELLKQTGSGLSPARRRSWSASERMRRMGAT